MNPFAMDLLRYVPGVAFNQSGAPGGVTSLFLRGGNANLNLVEIDGVPVIGFGGGLGFDFAHIPSEAVDHIDVIRGAQSAVYGSYANSGVIDFVTRRPEAAPSSICWPKAAATTSAASPSPARGPSPASACWSPPRATIPMAW